MTTKDEFVPLKKQPIRQNIGAQNQFSNLNLSQNRKCLNVSLVQPNNKSISKSKDFGKHKCCSSLTMKNYSIDENIVQVVKITILTAPTLKIDSQILNDEKRIWRKSLTNNLHSKPLKSVSAFVDGEENVKTKKWKNDSSNAKIRSSTLSLHIAAYEHSIEGGDNVTSYKKEGLIKDLIKERKQVSINSTLNPFEFPRQQTDDVSKPEVMQFTASQKLLNPNQSNSSKDNQQGTQNAEGVRPALVHFNQRPPPPSAQIFGSGAFLSTMEEFRVDEDELAKDVESFSIIDDSEEKLFQGINNNDNSGAEISMEARQAQWVNLLGVRNKPDQLIDWDHLYNLNDQAELRKQCQKVVENVQSNNGDKRERKTKVTVPALESMMTLWCKKRKIQNASKVHWTDLMSVLIEMDFDNPTLFNIFFAITTKYIPRDIDENGKTYDLFRLIMQYHDPEICSHLDSLKITPYSYASSWFNSLFSKDLDVKLCLQLWDIYFERGDPFLVFFISLCLVQSARDQILQMKDKNAIISFLQDIPKNMSVEDITDLIDVCKTSISLTPLSVQEDFHCMLFGANMVEDFYELPLQTLLCLPISVQELYKRSVDGGAYGVMMPYNYFVIDTRSQKEFSSGSIPGSYNLSGRLLVDVPEKFTNAMTTLMRFKKESCPTDHICFFGSGLEEDDSYMVMVISSFLHKNVNHISYVDGGYRALHSVLKETNNLNKLSNHFDGNACLHCNGQKDEAKESFTWSVMERMNQQRKGLKDAAKNMIEYFPKFDIFGRENAQHAKSDERNQKRYRNVQSVFTLEDSDESDNDATFELDASNANERLKWCDIIKKPEITHNFEGLEILPDKSVTPCFIALSRTHMHVFHEVPEDKSFIKTSARHSLGTVMRVSSKKQHPEYLTFQFGYELPTGEAHINRIQKFVVSKSGELATACKNNIFALRPNLFD